MQESTVPVKHAHLFGGNTDNSYFQHQRIETVDGNEDEDPIGENQRWDEVDDSSTTTGAGTDSIL